MDYESLTDEELIPLIAEHHDTRAYSELYDRYWTLLYRFASKSMRDQEDAKDIVQDVFSALWEKRDSLHIHRSVSAYLYQATFHRVINRVNRVKFADAYLESLKQAGEAAEASTDQFIFEKELRKRFEAGLEMLPGKMREVFECSRIEGLSHKEISEKLDISSETVKRQIKKALKILRTRLSSWLFLFL